mgnify:CR=1 FL=1
MRIKLVIFTIKPIEKVVKSNKQLFGIELRSEADCYKKDAD